MDFRKKITSYTPEVDTEAWQQMESLLDQGGQPAPLNGKAAASSNFLLWIGIGVVTLLLLAVVLRNNWTNNQVHSDATKIDVEATSEQQEVPSTVTDSNYVGATDAKQVTTTTVVSDIQKNNIRNNGQTESASNTKTINKERVEKSARNVNNYSIPQNSGVAKKTSVVTKGITAIQIENKLQKSYTESKGKSNTNAPLIFEENFVSQNTTTLPITAKDRDDLLKDSKAFALQKIMGKEFKLKYDRTVIETEEVQLIKPIKPPSKYTLGIEIGQAQTVRYRLGAQFSVHGMYDINSYLSTGLRMGFSRIIEPGNYTIDPGVRSYERDVTFHWYTAITPIRIWKISLGIEGGYGYTWSSTNQRVAESTGTGSRYVYNSYIIDGMSFMLGAKADVIVSENMKIGLFYGGNAATETTMNGVRLIWRI